ncbi:MAG: ubiquinol-cytochrome c reductase iron-sulfur subunit [Planctomycetes bacterium]|nr:ubiquinol-cytochrome c reductase iron-sulfur subunit [Planctomycetota bacterium]
MPTKPDYAKGKPGAKSKPGAKGKPGTKGRPARAKAGTEDRRGVMSLMFGSALGVGFTMLGATHVLWGLATTRFMFPNVLVEPPSRVKVGFPADFPQGQVVTKFKAQFGIWVVKGEYDGLQQIYALKTVCTHLGCTPNWLDAEQKFKCPCHGSGFYADGINFEGPAPRPLERYAIKISEDGQLEVDKSKVFMQEKGEWNDPASFVSV